MMIWKIPSTHLDARSSRILLQMLILKKLASYFMPMVVRLEAMNILGWLIAGVEKVHVWEPVEYFTELGYW